jgi:hypothetical protein
MSFQQRPQILHEQHQSEIFLKPSMACTNTARTPTVSAACSLRVKASWSSWSQSLALLGDIHGQSGEYDHADRVGRQAV